MGAGNGEIEIPLLLSFLYLFSEAESETRVSGFWRKARGPARVARDPI